MEEFDTLLCELTCLANLLAKIYHAFAEDDPPTMDIVDWIEERLPIIRKHATETEE